MPSVTLKIGQSVPVTANIVDDNGNPATAGQIAWVSDTPAIATVTNNSFVSGSNNTVSTNTITGIANGEATVTCTVDGQVINTVDVLVDSPSPTVVDLILGTPTP